MLINGGGGKEYSYKGQNLDERGRFGSKGKLPLKVRVEEEAAENSGFLPSPGMNPWWCWRSEDRHLNPITNTINEKQNYFLIMLIKNKGIHLIKK